MATEGHARSGLSPEKYTVDHVDIMFTPSLRTLSSQVLRWTLQEAGARMGEDRWVERESG